MSGAAHLDRECDPKTWSTLAAKLALHGWMLWRTDPNDGTQRYFAARWGAIYALASLDEVERFLEQVR